MNYLNLRNYIWKHLANYKNQILDIFTTNIERNTTYYHFLPDPKLNLINEGFYTELDKSYNKVSIHPDFFHLNSSQAFALNFFVPLESKGLLNILIDDTAICSCFEKEDPTEKTNFDYYIQGENGVHVFEVKYTEEGFGKPDIAKYGKSFYENRYIKFYKQHIETISKQECLSKIEKDYYNQYQLWRYISYADRRNVYFVFPSFRYDLERKVNEAVSFLKNEYQTKIHIIFVDRIVKKLCKNEDLHIASHYQHFYKKYLDLIDISFDVRTDCDFPNEDPDKKSEMLKQFHRQLWYKTVKSSEKEIILDANRCLKTDNCPYLWIDLSETEYKLTSDSMINFFLNYKTTDQEFRKIIEKIKNENSKNLQEALKIGYSIGNFILFPGNQIPTGESTINQARGQNTKISDRWDLTLIEIKNFYEGKTTGSLYDVLLRYKNFFSIFSGFTEYCEFFLLQDFLNDEGNVKLLLDREKGNPLPKNEQFYWEYINNAVEVIKKRNLRIRNFIENEYCLS